jgi:hypothetical protein
METFILILFLVLGVTFSSANLARLIHFAIGFQYGDLNVNAMFGSIGYWLIQESKYNWLNNFKEAITCIFCLTHHIATLQTLVIFTLMFNFWYALLALILIPALAFTLQNILHIYIFSRYDGND